MRKWYSADDDGMYGMVKCYRAVVVGDLMVNGMRSRDMTKLRNRRVKAASEHTHTRSVTVTTFIFTPICKILLKKRQGQKKEEISSSSDQLLQKNCIKQKWIFYNFKYKKHNKTKKSLWSFFGKLSKFCFLLTYFPKNTEAFFLKHRLIHYTNILLCKNSENISNH